jgi:hypothetical protein
LAGGDCASSANSLRNRIGLVACSMNIGKLIVSPPMGHMDNQLWLRFETVTQTQFDAHRYCVRIACSWRGRSLIVAFESKLIGISVMFQIQSSLNRKGMWSQENRSNHHRISLPTFLLMPESTIVPGSWDRGQIGRRPNIRAENNPRYINAAINRGCRKCRMFKTKAVTRYRCDNGDFFTRAWCNSRD